MSKNRTKIPKLEIIDVEELPLSKLPKSGKIIEFTVTCRVPVEYWAILSKEGFREDELGEILAQDLEQVADQLPLVR